jgi:hypothetical protein
MGTNIYRTADGAQVPGVTTVLGSSLGWKTPGLIHWAWKLGIEGKDYKAERNRAADVGSLAHACAEARIIGKPLPALPEEHRAKVEGALSAFDAWRAESRIDLVASEVPLISEAHHYGGCIDAVGVFDGVAQLVDFKSSKDLYPDQICQVAAYASLWTENHPDLPIRAWHILRWGPGGDFHHHALNAEQIAAGWRVFLAALQIYTDRKLVMGRAA